MNVGEFFKTVGHTIKAAVVGGAHLFVHLFGKDAVDELVAAAKKILASDFGKVIEVTLEELVAYKAEFGDTAAREMAFSKIKDAAVSAGLDLKDSLVNLLIELAANKLNGTLDSLTKATLGG